MDKTVIVTGIFTIVGAVVGAVICVVGTLIAAKRNAVSSRINIYKELYEEFCSLREKADLLWSSANQSNLSEFKQQLKRAEYTVKRNEPLIERNLVFEMEKVIDFFKEFKRGKQALIDIRNISAKDKENFRRFIENLQISFNKDMKDNYDILLKRLEEKIREIQNT